MKERARDFRKNQTYTENRMWYYLRNRRLSGYKFLREHVIGSYIVDFVCREKKLILEIDGAQHAEQEEYDNKRTAFLESQGFKVMRVGYDEVNSNIDGVLEGLLLKLESDVE